MQNFLQKIGWGSGCLLLFVSCYSAPIVLTAEGESVQLFLQPEEFPQCLFLDNYRAMTLAARENSYQQALNKIKNKVAIYQGTHLKINTSDTNELVTVILGEGYRCPLTEDGRIQEMRIKSIYSESQ